MSNGKSDFMNAASKTPVEIKDLWQTPPEVFAALNAEFKFTMDVAASADNKLLENYLSEGDDTLHALTEWGNVSWCNPPYSKVLPWIYKAKCEAEAGCTVVMLLPCDTSVGWFAQALVSCSEVRFITDGRLSFVRADTKKAINGNNKGSVLFIWRPMQIGTGHVSFVPREHLMELGRMLLGREKAKVAA